MGWGVAAGSRGGMGGGMVGPCVETKTVCQTVK